MMFGAFAVQAVVVLVLPILFIGVVNRTKAIFAGRKGPPLLQTWFDIRRLARKQPVYSEVTTAIFRLGPLVVLATTLTSALFVPLGGRAPLSSPYDFVAIAYLWGLGRAFLILGALDTGSSFEGMGASREATYSAFVEPALFLTLGSLVLATGQRSLDGMLHVAVGAPHHVVVIVAGALALFLVLQVEAARVPVDDPATHLELTMIHEVMVLDHSGPDLAALQYASALKATLAASILTVLVLPFSRIAGLWLTVAASAAVLGTAVVVGGIESLVARLKLNAVPEYVMVALIAGFISLMAASWGAA